MDKTCLTCKWLYETERHYGCDSPSPDRATNAEHHHYYEPCKLWEQSDKAKDIIRDGEK